MLSGAYCAALPAKARADYFALLHPAGSRLSLYEANHMVAAKTETLNTPLFILYAGLIFWTVGYDTIYACQDIEDDMKIGVKSTARRFGKRVKLGVGINYAISALFIFIATTYVLFSYNPFAIILFWGLLLVGPGMFAWHLKYQVSDMAYELNGNALKIFKSNIHTALLLITGYLVAGYAFHGNIFNDFKVF